ncbi:MAG: hypothetical protein RLZZ259_98, partial [Pseudomonadota bacterium]
MPASPSRAGRRFNPDGCVKPQIVDDRKRRFSPIHGVEVQPRNAPSNQLIAEVSDHLLSKGLDRGNV